MPKLNLTERVLPKMTQQRKSAANERCRAEMLRWPSKILNQGLFFRSLDISFGFAKPRDQEANGRRAND